MKKKVLTVLLTGAMVASMAAGATVVSAEDNDNTLTVWAWDQNFNIKSMQIAADQYAADHEGFSVDIIETSSDDCQTKLTTAANAGDYSTLPDIVLMQDNSYQKFLKAYPDAFTDLKDMNVNWDDFGALKQSYSMVDDTHYGVPLITVLLSPATVQISLKKQDIHWMTLQISHGPNSKKSVKIFTRRPANTFLQAKQQAAIPL